MTLTLHLPDRIAATLQSAWEDLPHAGPQYGSVTAEQIGEVIRGGRRERGTR